jgi:hypothetical protein
MGIGGRANELRAAIEEILNLSIYWHELADSLEITDRAKSDIAHLYYGLPAPGCDLELLINMSY